MKKKKRKTFNRIESNRVWVGVFCVCLGVCLSGCGGCGGVWGLGVSVCVWFQCYSTKQRELFDFFECKAPRVAVSKTARTPSLVLAEHSKYEYAPILSAMALPCSVLTGSCLIFISSFLVASSLRKSFLFPARRREKCAKIRWRVKFKPTAKQEVDTPWTVRTYEDDGNIWTKMLDFGVPFFRYVFQTVWRVDAEAHENNVCIWIAERSQTIVILLASWITGQKPPG